MDQKTPPLSINTCLKITHYTGMYLFVSEYLSLLPVSHLSDALRRQLVVTEDSARIQDKTNESFAWFFKSLPHNPDFKRLSGRRLGKQCEKRDTAGNPVLSPFLTVFCTLSK